MLKKIMFFGMAVILGMGLVIGPMMTPAAAQEETTKVPWIYKSIYKDVIEYIFDNGTLNPWAMTLTFLDSRNGTLWEFDLMNGFIIIWEKDFPRKDVYFITLDLMQTGLGVDAYGIMREDGSIMRLSDAEIYKTGFYKHLTEFFHTYLTPEEWAE